MRGPGWLLRRWRAEGGCGDAAPSRAHAGQASVELVALLPLIALAAVVVVQVGLAAHAWGAAREAA
ncbi:MAG: hypothetical protein FJW92_05605, partial [Actinobacteria bacterium]|nr:hypothetical protein [Actinomycetota bacterium]